MSRREYRTAAKQQRGVALIMVLLVVALVATLAVSMGGKLQLQITRTKNLQDSEQGYWYLQSAEALVRQVLIMELNASEGKVHLGQNWAQQDSAFPVDGGMIQGKIRDLRGCFNLNSLNSDGPTMSEHERRKTQLRTLLLQLEVEAYSADTIVDSLVDWIDKDDLITGTYGAEDADYESLPYPYRAGNTPLVHVSELRLIRGVTRDIYRKVKPYVCVIPDNFDGKINVNTIPVEQPELLVAVLQGEINTMAAIDILVNRPEDGYDEVSEFSAENAVSDAMQRLARERQSDTGLNDDNESDSGIPNLSDDDDEDASENGEADTGLLDDIQLESEYFELRGNVRVDDLIQSGTSIIKIENGKAEVLYRGLGN